MPPALPSDKAGARRVLRTARRARRDTATDAGWRELGETLADRLSQWLRTRPAPAVVAVYESLPAEPPTGAIIESLQAQGIRPIVPVLLADKDLGWRDLAGVDLGVEAINAAGLVLTPGLAVARPSGLRLGQGGGSYDRALRRVNHGTPVVTVLFDDELADWVPSEPHDRAVDAVLTPRGGVTRVGPNV